ncbi:MAG: hypothetical protein [Microvirus sp.]|nr:MAG: hypothetical protein [Microvirus sp.]
MSALYRHPVNKKKSRRKFNKKAKKTKAANIHTKVMRGGIRL